MKTLFRICVFLLLSASAFAQVTESPTSTTIAPSRNGRSTYTIFPDGSIVTYVKIGGVVTSFTIAAGAINQTQARNSLSATGPLNYNNSTGAFSIPASTSSTDGYLSASNFQLFNSKEPAIPTGSTAQYLRGDKSLSTFLTDARNGISGAGLINYTAGTGAITTNAISGDVSIPAGGTAATLATVNASPGTFGSTSAVAIPTVNAKGLVTGITTATITAAGIGAQTPQTTLAGYGITNAEPINTVATYAAMNAISMAANTFIRICVLVDEVYNNAARQWYKVYAGGDGVTHVDKEIVNSEK